MYMPNIAQGLSLEILLIVVISYLWYRSLTKRHTRNMQAFFRLCSSLMLFLIIDFPVRLSDLALVSWKPLTTYILNALYIGAEVFTVYEWFDYFLVVQGSKTFSKPFMKFIMALPMLITFILLIVSYKTHWLFYIDDNGMYTRGTLFFLQFLLPYSYLIASFVSAFIGLKKNKDVRMFRILLFAFVPALISSMLQLLYSGSFTHMGLCLVVILMYVEIFEDELRKIEVERKANDSKSAFLARMSHDMRTPLNGILGLMEIDDRNPDNVELIASNRKKSKAAAKHLLSLINDVLDLSKLEDGKIELARECFSMSELMEDVLSIVQAKAYGTGITIINKNEGDGYISPNTYGSPLHIRRVLLNIIDNAIKYNKENGSVSISLQHEEAFKEHIKYKITIADTGIGMSKDYLKRLFDPFSQEHIDAKSISEGTGLGMTITKALIEKMGGKLHVESTPGEGSTFIITLTLELAEGQTFADGADSESADLSGIHILLVEDNELNSEIAVELLTDLGAEVELACNGQVAVDMYSAAADGTFDVILMDCMMPVLDGYEATRTIRLLEREEAREIPIIAMTANAYVEDVKKCLDAGMNDHIAKPFDINRVVEVVNRHVKMRGATKKA